AAVGRRAGRRAEHARDPAPRGVRVATGRLRAPGDRLRRRGQRPRPPQRLRHAALADRPGRRCAFLAADAAEGGTGGMSPMLRALALLLAAGTSACASLSPQEQVRATALIQDARPREVDCDRRDACATPSPLHQLGATAMLESTPGAPRHRALILDGGQDALLARISLLRSATTSIDLQTYIFDEDDAGTLFLHELISAARRGVRVRLLVDQLSALKRVETLAALSGAHANFSIRIYNPVLDRARLGYVQYLFAAACCWGTLNKRMHTKLLLVDGVVGITGGRNYQDDYFDWDAEYNFRDR